MRITFFAALLSTLSAVVFAQDTPFYFTSPVSGTVWKAGSTGKITWLNGLDQSVGIRVLQGSDPTTMQPTGYSIEIPDGTSGSYDWMVPSDLSPDQSYALQLIYMDNSGSTTLFSYSSAFSITGGSGNTSASGTSSGAPSSSVVASPSSGSVSNAASTASAGASSNSAQLTSSQPSATGSVSLSASVSLGSQSPDTNVAPTAFDLNAFAMAIPLFILGAVMA